MKRQQELEKRKECLKSAPLEDYLMEDPQVFNQNYFILSYLLPDEQNEIKSPSIKVRGSFKTQEDCEKRIQKLKNIDPYFNMYVCEVGKFGSLLPDEEIQKMDDVDIQYRESILNTMVKEYQDSKDKADAEFERRKRVMQKRAEYEGSKEGQEKLAKERENPVAVKTRVETMTRHLQELKQRIDEVNDIISLSKTQLSSYTKEELEKSEQEIKSEHKELFTVDDLATSKKQS